MEYLSGTVQVHIFDIYLIIIVQIILFLSCLYAIKQWIDWESKYTRLVKGNKEEESKFFS